MWAAAALDYYLTPGPMTDLSRCPKELLRNLPHDPDSLMRMVRGALISSSALRKRAISVPESRSSELQIRSASAMLEHIRDLAAFRPPELRLLGNCRQVATLTCALFRHRGIPTRVRAGFAGYFHPNTYDDHWIIEYWHVGECRWIRVDPQLDFEQSTSETLAAQQYFTGSEAWRACREGHADPNRFNMGGDNWGIGEVRGSVILDIAALNKMEMLPWDAWGRMDDAYSGKTDSAYDDFLDGVSAVVNANDFPAIRELYESSGDLRVPATP
jgi:hypothetical protein